MHKIMSIILVIYLMFSINIIAQCNTWNYNNHYGVGERVLFYGNAFEAKRPVSHYSPSYSYYWKWVPQCQTYCNLQISLYNTGSVTIDSLPDGTTGTYDQGYGSTRDDDYLCGSNIQLVATPYAGYKFLYWNDGGSNPTNPSIYISIDNDKVISPVFAVINYCTLNVSLNNNGITAIDTLPNGSIASFNSDDVSISLIYPEGSQVVLSAISDEGYNFVDWGDIASTTINPLTIILDSNFNFSPIYISGTTLFEVPTNCDSLENMRVDGRSRLFGYSEFGGDVVINDLVLIMDKIDRYDGVCRISPESIDIDALSIKRNKISIDDIRSNRMFTKNIEATEIFYSNSAFTRKVRVTTLVFPDFVFKKDYSLRTIPELKEYVTSNRHLPGISSEKEVKEGGLDLGALSKGLLQNIEEMTLYLIQLDSRLDKLEKRR